MYESEGAEIESVVRSVLLDASVKVNDLQHKERDRDIIAKKEMRLMKEELEKERERAKRLAQRVEAIEELKELSKIRMQARVRALERKLKLQLG
jgi:predicted Zn-dependent protease